MRDISWEGFLAGGLGSGWQASIGVFDGFHLGHARLIESLADRGLRRLVLSFSSNPKATTRDPSFARRLTTARQLVTLLEAAGVDAIVLIDFSSDFSRLSGAEFARAVASSGSIERVTVGTGFRCGKDLDSGTVELSRYFGSAGIRFSVIPKLVIGGIDVSSSRIRALVEAGALNEAGTLLGRPYAIDAVGARCEGRWRKLETDQVLPPEGVYPARAVTFDGAEFDTSIRVESGQVSWQGSEAIELRFGTMGPKPREDGSTRE